MLGSLLLPSIWLLIYPLIFSTAFLSSFPMELRKKLSRGAWVIFVVQPLMWFVLYRAIPNYDWIAISGHTLYWHERIILALPSASLLSVIVVNALFFYRIRRSSMQGQGLLARVVKLPATYPALAGTGFAFAQIRGVTSVSAYDNSMIFYMWFLVATTLCSISILFEEALGNTPVDERTLGQKVALKISNILTWIGLILPFAATPSF